jgi:hypothetical protein
MMFFVTEVGTRHGGSSDNKVYHQTACGSCLRLPFSPAETSSTLRVWKSRSNSSDGLAAGRVFQRTLAARFRIGLAKIGPSDDSISTGAHPTSGECLMEWWCASAPVHSVPILPPPSARRPSAAVCRTPAPRRERFAAKWSKWRALRLNRCSAPLRIGSLSGIRLWCLIPCILR